METIKKRRLERGEVVENVSLFELTKNVYYTGDLLNGKRHGCGIAIYYSRDGSNCTTYKGEWLNDKLDGFGIQISGNYIYEGMWKDGVKHGIGKEVINGRSTINGVWEGGILTGEGRKETNEYVFTGEFVLGSEKRGVRVYTTHPKYAKYIGTFSCNNILPTDDGLLFFQNGDQFKGRVLNENGDMKGEVIFSNGTSYEGEIYDYEMHGIGTYKTPEFSYSGEFRSGMKYGYGSYDNGERIYTGRFNDEKKVGLFQVTIKATNTTYEELYDSLSGTLVLSTEKYEEEKKDCKVCYERDANSALFPCGHVFCNVCTMTLYKDRCPQCRADIKRVCRVYLP